MLVVSIGPEEARRLTTDAVRRVFASKNECSPEASRLGRQLIEALDSLASEVETLREERDHYAGRYREEREAEAQVERMRPVCPICNHNPRDGT